MKGGRYPYPEGSCGQKQAECTKDRHDAHGGKGRSKDHKAVGYDGAKENEMLSVHHEM